MQWIYFQYVKIKNKDILFDKNVRISSLKKNNFKCIGKIAFYHGVYIQNNRGVFSIGNNSHLGAYTYVNVCHGQVKIGEDVAIGPHCNIIAYSNHYLNENGESVKFVNARIIGNIIIGNNVFIGANCTILPNTSIPDNVLIAAGSIVKDKLDSGYIYAGSPARPVKKYEYKS